MTDARRATGGRGHPRDPSGLARSRTARLVSRGRPRRRCPASRASGRSRSRSSTLMPTLRSEPRAARASIASRSRVRRARPLERRQAADPSDVAQRRDGSTTHQQRQCHPDRGEAVVHQHPAARRQQVAPSAGRRACSPRRACRRRRARSTGRGQPRPHAGARLPDVLDPVPDPGAARGSPRTPPACPARRTSRRPRTGRSPRRSRPARASASASVDRPWCEPISTTVERGGSASTASCSTRACSRVSQPPTRSIRANAASKRREVFNGLRLVLATGSPDGLGRALDSIERVGSWVVRSRGSCPTRSSAARRPGADLADVDRRRLRPGAATWSSRPARRGRSTRSAWARRSRARCRWTRCWRRDQRSSTGRWSSGSRSRGSCCSPAWGAHRLLADLLPGAPVTARVRRRGRRRVEPVRRGAARPGPVGAAGRRTPRCGGCCPPSAGARRRPARVAAPWWPGPGSAR